MEGAISDRNDVRELLQEAILRETLMERMAVWEIDERPRDEVDEELSELLFLLKTDEARHTNEFLALARELGLEMDLHGVEKEAMRRIEEHAGSAASQEEGLKRVMKEEESGYHFFTDAAEAFESAAVAGVDTDDVAERFRAVAEEKQEYFEELGEMAASPLIRVGWKKS